MAHIHSFKPRSNLVTSPPHISSLQFLNSIFSFLSNHVYMSFYACVLCCDATTLDPHEIISLSFRQNEKKATLCHNITTNLIEEFYPIFSAHLTHTFFTPTTALSQIFANFAQIFSGSSNYFVFFMFDDAKQFRMFSSCTDTTFQNLNAHITNCYKSLNQTQTTSAVTHYRSTAQELQKTHDAKKITELVALSSLSYLCCFSGKRGFSYYPDLFAISYAFTGFPLLTDNICEELAKRYREAYNMPLLFSTKKLRWNVKTTSHLVAQMLRKIAEYEDYCILLVVGIEYTVLHSHLSSDVLSVYRDALTNGYTKFIETLKNLRI